jgi:hypothetical protein
MPFTVGDFQMFKRVSEAKANAKRMRLLQGIATCGEYYTMKQFVHRKLVRLTYIVQSVVSSQVLQSAQDGTV